MSTGLYSVAGSKIGLLKSRDRYLTTYNFKFGNCLNLIYQMLTFNLHFKGHVTDFELAFTAQKFDYQSHVTNFTPFLIFSKRLS